MFEHVVLVASMIPDKRVREEKLPRLVFDEFNFPPAREESHRGSRLPRFFSRQRRADSDR